MKPADAKLQRWIDLVAALLSHRYGVSFAELKSLVPAYGAAKNAATLARMFERDKDELRALGIPIRVREEESDDGMEQRYYVRASEMYLPYLAVASRGRGASRSSPRRVPPAGYRDLTTVRLESDEIFVLMDAAHAARGVGDLALEHDAGSAILKLTYDRALARGDVPRESSEARPPNADLASAPAVVTLGEALLRRKRVSLVYYSINRDATERREIEPYGLSFTGGHWYVVGRDTWAEIVRKFRVSRIAELTVNASKPQSVDYEIPKDFDLAEEARVLNAWELGDGVAEEMIVEIVEETGATAPVREMREPVIGAPNQRRFRVRRLDKFVRWLMSFAGEVVPVSPPHLVDTYRAMASATLAEYGGASAERGS